MNHSSTRLSQISNIRALAIFIVVLGHCIILYSPGWGIYDTTQVVPFLATLKSIINIFQMPLFFSLSGYLFVFSHAKKRGFLNLIKSKVRRLLLPYLSICLLYLIPLRTLIHYPGYQNKSPEDVVSFLLLGTDVGHLWFLPTLFLVFLLAELLMTLGEHLPFFNKHPDWFLYLGAVVLYLEGYRIFFGYQPLRSAYIYLLWFTAGYFLNRMQGLLKTLYRSTPVKVLLILANIFLTVIYLRTEHAGLILSLGLPFLFFLNIYGLMPERTSPLVQKIDRNSFGIYLFHSPLIYITFTFIPNAMPLLVVFINLVVFGTAAYCLTELSRRCRLGFLIGE